MQKKTEKDILSKNNLKVRIVLESIIVGAIAGLIVSLYRLALKYIAPYEYKAYSFMKENNLWIILGIVVLIILAYIVGFMVEKNSMISGSGIPQIEGMLKGEFDIKNPIQILVEKFIGGTIAIGAGLSLGIEGPSIQLGAEAAHVYSNVTKKCINDKRFLIASAAGAGLAAAFNAPLAGVFFVLEEMYKCFSKMLFLCSIAACVTADLVTWIFFGSKPILEVNIIKALPAKYYIFVIILGIVVGICGVIYNKTLLKTIKLYKCIKIKLRYRMIIPFMFALFFGIVLPQVLGGGDILINDILLNGVAFKFAIILLISKFILSIASFASDTPGGILFPLLTLGALVGITFSGIITLIAGESNIYATNFILLGMAGMFSSIVRAPITGLILVCEMSGPSLGLGAVSLVCGIAYLIAEIFKCKPIYESLLDNRLKAMGLKEEE
ncbi:ClC family H(+)/Cl(-) exchange transporter [Clostridium sp. Ade.TY]|uniref:ClC family H(+)/Cl(-) exchange transporter n=1 Tax=Clostridium sp. Ade.TY TaxID=1391647 RepID=UPI00040EC8B7|nr:ClC family H(+)/Cl(-) exchange transporter [Clostridium sp. Ade.TY]